MENKMMQNKMMQNLLIAVASASALFLGGCLDDAQVAKHNMSKAADNFEINRRIVFYNAWLGENVLSVEGRCSVEYKTNRTYYICKIGRDRYVNNFIGRSDNIVAIVEQLDPVPLNVYHFRRTFKPQSVIPDIDFRGDSGELLNAITPDEND